MSLPEKWIEDVVARALDEDLDQGSDLTAEVVGLTGALKERRASAKLIAKAPGVLAGLDLAVHTFRRCDPDVVIRCHASDGDRVEEGQAVLEVEGRAGAVLLAERTALNFLQRLSGVATQTRRFVDAIAGTGARVLETRKTTPGLRRAEKAAVVHGGGSPHRSGLFDQVLLKENHFACARPATFRQIVEQAVATNPTDRPVIAEATDLNEAEDAVRGGAGVVMLDNFAPGSELRDAVQQLRALADSLGRTLEIEVSGGITLDTARAYAESGADRLSVGALTHSVPALDLSLLVDIEGGEA